MQKKITELKLAEPSLFRYAILCHVFINLKSWKNSISKEHSIHYAEKQNYKSDRENNAFLMKTSLRCFKLQK